jgi:S1-C subfamily serine protease
MEYGCQAILLSISEWRNKYNSNSDNKLSQQPTVDNHKVSLNNSKPYEQMCFGVWRRFGNRIGRRSESTSKEIPLEQYKYKESFVQDAICKIGPSVVRIDCKRDVASYFSPLRDIFEEGEVVRVSGSGIVVSHDGLIITNAHVIDQSNKVL